MREISVGNVEGARDALSTHFKGRFSAPLADSVSASLGVSALDEEAISTSALANGGEDVNDARSARRTRPTAVERLGRLGPALDPRDHARGRQADIGGRHVRPRRLRQRDHSAGLAGRGRQRHVHWTTMLTIVATASAPRVHSDLEVREATLLTDYDLANGRTLSAVTSWDEYELFVTANDVAQVAAPVLRYRNTLATESFQQDVRITSAAGTSFDWLAGLFYFQSEHERGDGGDRPMWLYDELSDDPAVGALHQALFNFPASAAVRNARSNRHARRCAGHRLRQRVWPHDLAPRTPIRSQHGPALAGRAERRARDPADERPGAEHDLADPRPCCRERERIAPRHARADLVGDAAVVRFGHDDAVHHVGARLQVRRIQHRVRQIADRRPRVPRRGRRALRDRRQERARGRPRSPRCERVSDGLQRLSGRRVRRHAIHRRQRRESRARRRGDRRHGGADARH